MADKELGKSAPLSDLPKELIQQYKIALGGVTDIRLVVLLLFNSFEEVMKAFGSWRLSCKIDELPRQVTNSSSLLFQLVLVDRPDLRTRCEQFANIRNTVAHRFHTKEFEPKLHAFVKDFLKADPPGDPAAFRTELINCVFGLALDVATHFIDFPDRGEYPFPYLSLELAAEK